MRYVCLVYGDEAALARLPAEERKAMIDGSAALHASLRKSGRGLAGAELHPAETATTLRVRDGRILVGDGPTVDTKEQLGGLYLIDARDLNDAIRTAAAIPTARFGAVEVRPVRSGGKAWRPEARVRGRRTAVKAEGRPGPHLRGPRVGFDSGAHPDAGDARARMTREDA